MRYYLQVSKVLGGGGGTSLRSSPIPTCVHGLDQEFWHSGSKDKLIRSVNNVQIVFLVDTLWSWRYIYQRSAGTSCRHLQSRPSTLKMCYTVSQPRWTWSEHMLPVKDLKMYIYKQCLSHYKLSKHGAQNTGQPILSTVQIMPPVFPLQMTSLLSTEWMWSERHDT
jgi:hypothetical protein